MRHINTSNKRNFFDVLVNTPSAQAAMMTLPAGQASSDEPDNEHPQAEQWLFVVSGAGEATVGRRTIQIGEGSLLVIEKAEEHQITNTSRAPLVTLNLYVPPAYTKRRRGA